MQESSKPRRTLTQTPSSLAPNLQNQKEPINLPPPRVLSHARARARVIGIDWSSLGFGQRHTEPTHAGGLHHESAKSHESANFLGGDNCTHDSPTFWLTVLVSHLGQLAMQKLAGSAPIRPSARPVGLFLKHLGHEGRRQRCPLPSPKTDMPPTAVSRPRTRWRLGGGLVYGAPLRSISGSGCDSLAGELQTAPNIGADSVATGSGTFRIKTS